MKKWYVFGAILGVMVLWTIQYFLHNNSAAAEQRVLSAIPIASKRVLDSPSELILYSLNSNDSIETYPKKKLFRNFIIVGQSVVKNPQTQKQLTQALYDGIAYNDRDPASCFLPHHALRAKKGQDAVDVVICFGCKQVQVFGVFGKSGGYIAREPQAVFDRILNELNVPLGNRRSK